MPISQKDKDAWIEALESGEFKPICGFLYVDAADSNENDPKTMCCLGVLAYINGDLEKIECPKYPDSDKQVIYYVCSLNKCSGIVPNGYMGLTGDEIFNLSNDNDKSFVFNLNGEYPIELIKQLPIIEE